MGEKMLPNFRKYMYISAGTLFLVIGSIGIFVPILPTTPFLILTTACYMKGSKKMYYLIINNRIFGNFIKNYYERNGISVQAKIFSISFLWLTISFSIFFILNDIWIKSILFIIAITVTIHVLSIKKRRKNETISSF